MIDFDEELSKFKPSLDVSSVEDLIVKSDISDMNDILIELIRENIKGWLWTEKEIWNRYQTATII